MTMRCYRFHASNVLSSNAKSSKFAPLKGKTIWVTGASTGIGAELVCQLVEAEARHVILSSRNKDRLVQVAQGCAERIATTSRSSSSEGSPSLQSQPTTKLSILPYDAEQSEDNGTIEDLVSKAISMTESNPIDMIFLNAGIYQVQTAVQSTTQDTRRIMKVNFLSPVELVITLMRLDRWKERGYGHIVVTGSLVSHGGHSLASSYAASKHALRGYFQSLSTEEFQWLRVDFVCPGAVKTNLWNALNDCDLAAADEAKLGVERFVHLMLTGVTGPWLLFYETWISKAEGLLWIALAVYMPHLFHVVVHILGLARMTVWENSAQTVDPLDLPQLVQAVCTTLLDGFKSWR